MSRRPRVLIAIVAFALLPVTLAGQSARTLELSLLGGSAHTDRVARLQAEEWIEPFAGLRLDVRLFARWGGRGGIVLLYDRYRVARDLRVQTTCIDFCLAYAAASSLLPSADFRVRASDSRFSLGATWQQPIASWLRADLMAFAGTRRAVNELRLGDVIHGEPPVRRAVTGGEVGVSSAWRSLIAGVGFQYATGSQWDDVRRGQNRVVLRAGYALRLGRN